MHRLSCALGSLQWKTTRRAHAKLLAPLPSSSFLLLRKWLLNTGAGTTIHKYFFNLHFMDSGFQSCYHWNVYTLALFAFFFFWVFLISWPRHFPLGFNSSSFPGNVDFINGLIICLSTIHSLWLQIAPARHIESFVTTSTSDEVFNCKVAEKKSQQLKLRMMQILISWIKIWSAEVNYDLHFNNSHRDNRK